jgi:hypothetical protein
MPLVECTTLYGEKLAVPAERLTFRPSAYAIIRHEEQILLLTMRSTGKWFLPGGGSEVAERLEVEAPCWVPIKQLRSSDIQSHGEIALAALQQKDPPD